MSLSIDRRPASTVAPHINTPHRFQPSRLFLATSLVIYGSSSMASDQGFSLFQAAQAGSAINIAQITQTTRLMFIDQGLPDYQTLINAAEPDVQVVLLDTRHDGLQQIADRVRHYRNLDSITIVSHGDAGVLLLGSGAVQSNTLSQYQAHLRLIGAALKPHGEILLYGCDVAAGSQGKTLLDALAKATGATIAASNNDTGAARQGGDWELEIATGIRTAQPVLDVQKLQQWDHLAHTASVSTRAELVSAIASAVNDNSNDTITLTSDITLSSGQAISINVLDGQTLTIEGGGHTLSGGNATRVFSTATTNSGSKIALQNLTIANGFLTANGGDSLSSGPVAGGDALGAAISNSGTLTISSVTFSGNKAAGGGGGAAGPGGQSGGGGGGGGFSTSSGGTGGNNDSYTGSAGSAGKGGNGAGTNSAPEIGGYGGTTTGGNAGALSGGSTGGKGATASDGTNSIGGGGGGGGNYTAGARGGHAVAAIYNNGGTISISSSTFSNNIAAGGGGGGGSVYANFPGNGGSGGYGVAAIWNKSGTVNADTSSKTSITGVTNVGSGGFGGYAKGGGGSPGTNRGANQTLGTIGTLVSAPTVSSVAALSSDGSYKAGDSIDINVVFSAAVTVDTTGGTPRLQLETGSTDEYANYISGSTSTTLVFRYTVQSGDNSSDLQYLSTSALALNGGTIKLTSDGTTAATLTLPGTSSGNSLAELSNILVDGVAPNAPGTPDLASASDSGVSSSDNLTNKTTPTFTGTADASSTVRLYDTDGTTQLASTTANGAGKWSMTSSTLSEGSHSISAKASDSLGNTSSASSSLTVTIDTTAPVTSPSAPTVDSGTDSGSSNGDGITNVSGPDFNGTGADANRLVNVYADGSLLGTTLSDGSGNFSYTATFLADGAHTITAKNVDNAGNIGPASSGTSITIDSDTPSAPTTPDLSSGSDTGTSSSDDLTYDTTPTLIGTTEANAIATLYDTDGTTVLGTATADGSGNWSITSSTLSDGTHTLSATATDVAGNTSSLSSGLSVTIDSSAPSVSAPDLASGSDSGSSSSDNITNVTTPTFTGTASANSTVTLYDTDGTTTLGNTTANGSGKWSITASTLSVGAHTVTTKASDAAGNTSTASSGLSVTIDTDAPSTNSIVVADSTLTGSETTTVTFTFSEAIRNFDNSDISIENGSLSTVSSGDGGITWTATLTPNGGVHDATNVITVDNTGYIDIAGNAGDCSSISNNYTIDSQTDNNLTALVVSSGQLSPAFDAYTTSYSDMVSSSTSSITVTPTLVDSAGSVTVNGITVADGTPSSPISLRYGSNTVTVVATDHSNSISRTYTLNVKRGAIAASPMVDGGGLHTLMLKSDGTVWSFGRNDNGQLGLGHDASPISTPTQATALKQISALRAGATHSLALQHNGSVYAFGANDYGQLGLGGAPGGHYNTPAKLSVSGIVNVQAGDSFSLLRQTDGTVLAFGDNSSGQLGQGNTTGPLTTPTAISSLGDTVAISAGAHHAMALKADGTVWVWGRNDSGQLGLGNTTSPVTTPTAISGLSQVVSIQAGDGFSLALKKNGTVWAWGSNSSGELGQGSTDSSGCACQNAPLQVSGLTDVIAIDAGAHHAVALKKDGTVWVWGDNTYAQLGEGNTSNIYTSATQISGLSNIVWIRAGANHSMALRGDGSLWTWGANSQGQLGLLTTTSPYTSPTQVDAGSHVASSLSSAPLDFGSLSRGNSSSASVETLSTTGTLADVDVNAVDVTNSGSLGLTYTPTTCVSGTLDNSSCTFTITGNADGKTGLTYNRLVIPTSSNFSKAITTLSTATVGGGHLMALEKANDYGAHAVGSNTDKTWTYMNEGDADVIISTAVVTGNSFTAQSNTCTGATLTPQQKCTITIRFTPNSIGAKTGRLTISSNDPVEPSLLKIFSGGSDGSRLLITGKPYRFGAKTLNSTTDMPITVTNKGNQTLNISSISDNSAYFSIVSDLCTSVPVAPNGTCSFSIRFIPTIGGTLTSVVTIASNDGASPSYELKPSGIGDAPNLHFGGPLHFPNTTVGNHSDLTTTMTNTGAQPLNFSGISLSSAHFSIFSTTCGSSLAVNSSCSVTVRFAPTSTGLKASSLGISSDDPINPSKTIPMSGTGQ